jgi:uncharacterized protein YkwD
MKTSTSLALTIQAMAVFLSIGDAHAQGSIVDPAPYAAVQALGGIIDAAPIALTASGLTANSTFDHHHVMRALAPTKGDWDFCAVSSECLNGCCSKQYSNDGKLKCTPGGSADQCVGGNPPPTTGKGDWDFCAVSSECLNGCCSKQYSNDGKLKCTPGGSADQCVGKGTGGNGLSASDTQSMLDSINSLRRSNGLGPLSIDARLERAATGHTNDQASRCTMSHTGGDGSSAGSRVTRQGYSWGLVAENVAAGQQTVQDVMSAWINSPGHRANLLQSSAVHVGFARATNNNCGSYKVYWTQNFARPL